MTDTLNIFGKYRDNLKEIKRVTVDGENYLRVDNIQGSVIYCPRYDHEMGWGTLFYGALEHKATEFVRKFLKPGMHTVDIGAFWGYHGFLHRTLVGHTGIVYMFEPLKTMCKSIELSIKANKYENINLLSYLIGNHTGIEVFNEELFAVGLGGKTELPMHKLDDLFLNFSGKLNYIKIDTVGHELEAMQGMTEIIKRNPNIVLQAEYCPDMWLRAGIYPTQLVDFAKENSLEIFVITPEIELEPFGEKHLHGKVLYGKNDEEILHEQRYTEIILLCRNKSVLG